MLKAKISLDKGMYSIGCLDSHNEAGASACFLKHTNQLYSNNNSNQFISYNFNYIGSLNKQLKMNILRFEKMQTKRIYEITFLLYNQYNKTLLLNVSHFFFLY